MHELSLCRGLLNQIERLAAQHHAQRVSRVVLQIGPLAGVDAKLLQHAFPFAVAGSIAAQANLEIEQLPIRVFCSQCRRESDASANRLICAKCGAGDVRLISGDELLLARLEFDATTEAEVY